MLILQLAFFFLRVCQGFVGEKFALLFLVVVVQVPLLSLVVCGDLLVLRPFSPQFPLGFLVSFVLVKPLQVLVLLKPLSLKNFDLRYGLEKFCHYLRDLCSPLG